MKLSTRIIFTLVLVVISFLALYFALAYITDFTEVKVNSLALIVALLIGIFMMAITAHADKAFIRWVIKRTLVISALGFFSGYIGPLIFTPKNTLGPLLGIFVTGPLSFVIGLIASALYEKAKSK